MSQFSYEKMQGERIGTYSEHQINLCGEGQNLLEIQSELVLMCCFPNCIIR